jgi:hypothetical protein
MGYFAYPVMRQSRPPGGAGPAPGGPRQRKRAGQRHQLAGPARGWRLRSSSSPNRSWTAPPGPPAVRRRATWRAWPQLWAARARLSGAWSVPRPRLPSCRAAPPEVLRLAGPSTSRFRAEAQSARRAANLCALYARRARAARRHAPPGTSTQRPGAAASPPGTGQEQLLLAASTLQSAEQRRVVGGVPRSRPHQEDGVTAGRPVARRRRQISGHGAAGNRPGHRHCSWCGWPLAS